MKGFQLLLKLSLCGMGSSFLPCRFPTRRHQISRQLATREVVRSEVAPRPTVTLAKGKARLFRDGELLVFGGACSQVQGVNKGNLKAGELVDVVDGAGNVVGFGVFNPSSMFRVRILWHRIEGPIPGPTDEEDDGGATVLEAVVRKKVRTALQKRKRCGFPSPGLTDAFRLVNSEGDGLSGLVVDVFGNTAVVSSGALWCEKWRNVIEAALLAEGSGLVKSVVWDQATSRLVQDGWGPPQPQQQQEQQQQQQEQPSQTDREGATDEVGVNHGVTENENEEALVCENGLRFVVSLENMQKTGFYCDQRENRKVAASLVQAGDRVLDLCCYSGGFSLNAARAGAKEVVGVDSSAAAVALATRNAALNGFGVTTATAAAAAAAAASAMGTSEEAKSATLRSDSEAEAEADTSPSSSGGGGVVRFEQSEIGAFMESARNSGDTFDVVVLDPPKLAPNRRSLDRAKNKYKKLNRAALRLVKPGGVLVTCTCSSAMATAPDNLFLATVQEAAREAGRSVTLLRKEGAAPDHTINPACLGGEYLVALFLYVE